MYTVVYCRPAEDMDGGGKTVLEVSHSLTVILFQTIQT